jgi:eukaryotic-like serine/threonine-protein kinase
MADSEPALLALAAAVADGSQVDWDVAESGASTPDERAVISQLRKLAAVGSSHSGTLERWGQFEIIQKIGHGSFGAVYLARDPRLGRHVALKLLHDTPLDQRLGAQSIAEGRLLAQIRHPNVVTVHGADQHDDTVGVWMEFVNGRTLKAIVEEHGPLGSDEAALIGRDICRALAAVHKAGFLHRDVKAQNVMREAGGRTVLMDFGAGDVAGDDRSARRVVTPAYVAPEVLAGAPPSVRSDLYSLGVLLYHLVTGEFPVVGASLEELQQLHVSGHRRFLRDARPNLPTSFVRVVDRATAANPIERPESAGAMERLLEDALGARRGAGAEDVHGESGAARPSKSAYEGPLRWAAGAAAVIAAIVTAWLYFSPWASTTRPIATDVHAVTVVPFAVPGGAEPWNTIAAAMAADVGTVLGGAGFLVKGRANADATAGDNSIAIAEKLGTEAVIHGALTVAGDQLELEVRVLGTKPGPPLWQRTYRAARTAAGTLPNQVALDVATALGAAPRAERVLSRSVRLEAYDHYARGRQLAEQREAATLLRATEHFEQAIKLDPTHAPAWAGLADAWIALGVPAFGPLRPFEARGRAREAALNALDLDPDLAEAHTSLAFLSYFHDWNWPAADERFQRALRLNPNDAQTHHWYADYLNAMGRFTEATEHINAACNLEPLSILYQRDVSWHLFFQRKYGEAIQQLRRTLSIDPTYTPAISLLGRALIQNGEYETGLEQLKRLDSTNAANAAMLAYGYAAAGERKQAQGWLARISALAAKSYVSPYSMALVHAALGDRTRALGQLTAAFDEQDSTIVNLRVDPRFDALRQDPSFVQLIARLRFPN